MKIRLYLEEDSMSHALVRGLRARGVDVITALEEGMVERDDEEHLEFATKMNRVLYSFNVADFYSLHSRYLRRQRTRRACPHTPATIRCR